MGVFLQTVFYEQGQIVLFRGHVAEFVPEGLVMTKVVGIMGIGHVGSRLPRTDNLWKYFYCRESHEDDPL